MSSGEQTFKKARVVLIHTAGTTFRYIHCTALTHNKNSEKGLTHPNANGTTAEVENPARSDVIKVKVAARANSYPEKWMALANAILNTDLALGLHSCVCNFATNEAIIIIYCGNSIFRGEGKY